MTFLLLVAKLNFLFVWWLFSFLATSVVLAEGLLGRDKLLIAVASTIATFSTYYVWTLL